MYFVLKPLKFYLHYSALHVSDTILSIIRSFAAAHAISGHVWYLVRCVLQSCYVVTAVTTQQNWRTQRTKHHTGPETACAAEKLLMMEAMLSETCRAE